MLSLTLTGNFYNVKQRYKLFLHASWTRKARVWGELCQAAAGSFCQMTSKHLFPRESASQTDMQEASLSCGNATADRARAPEMEAGYFLGAPVKYSGSRIAGAL